MQWDLVCDKNYLVEMSQSVFNFGVMVGAIIFTSMADRLGRKPIHLTCQYSMFAVGLAIAFAPNYITFVVLRFVQGAVREVSSTSNGIAGQLADMPTRRMVDLPKVA